MKKVINIMALVIVIAAAAFGIFMIGAKYCSTTTITMSSNIEPKTRIEVETESWD